MSNPEEALKWIVGIFNKHNVPFQIAGGFAARAHGSKRDLRDIDIFIPPDGFEKIFPDVKQYLVSGPNHRIGGHFLGCYLFEIKKIFPDVKQYMKEFGQYYQPVFIDRWDVIYLTLDYPGQSIDLADADNLRILDINTNKWMQEHIDLPSSEIKEVYGVSVSIMPKDRLIAYKRKVGREVDLIDIGQIK